MIATQSIIAASVLVLAHGPAVAIPPHPDDLVFEPIDFEPPSPDRYRHVLSNGVPVYLAPSHEFPLVTLDFTFRGGGYLDPGDQVGLASATASMMRRGGTTSVDAEDLDERFDFFAARASISGGDSSSSANLNCLVMNLDESLALFMDMLRNPGFQEDRLVVHRDQRLEAMKQRNDHADRILGREWGWLLYGRDHHLSSLATGAMVESLKADDLRVMHGRIFRPGNLLIAVTGDFEEAAMLERLEVAMTGWAAGDPVPWGPPPPPDLLEPGLYHVEKDIPQGRIQLGLRSLRRDDPDHFAALLMNRVLGGGGFSSRLTQRVRVDEGLAYGVGSGLSMPPWHVGTFAAGCQSKNRTVALAVKLILDEIDRIRTEPVTDEELADARDALVEQFPKSFESPGVTIGMFVNDELTNRDPGWWSRYRDNIAAVTTDDIQRVAQRLLVPERMVILVVGAWDEIAPGDLDGRASMVEFFGGTVTHLPLRDPITLDPLP